MMLFNWVFPGSAYCMERVLGALRQIIRDYLGTVNGVAHYRDEHVQFGGAGITVIDLE